MHMANITIVLTEVVEVVPENSNIVNLETLLLIGKPLVIITESKVGRAIPEMSY